MIELCVSGLEVGFTLLFLWNKFLHFLGITSWDRQVGCASATDFQLIGALANILGARIFMSLVLVEAVLPFIVLQMVIRQVSMLSLRALLFDL